jgi:branched-chain amino acid transport system ATP-binding protein
MGLSPAIQYWLAKSIQDIRNQRGTSIIVAEQYARPIMPIIDYGYILENGSAVVEGTKEELLDNPDVKAAYFGTH